MLAIDDIGVRAVLRRHTRITYGEKLGDSFEKWKKSKIKNTEQLVKTMISNAVASYAIRRKTWMIRALLYFLLAYNFYLNAGYIYYLQTGPEQLWSDVILLVLIILSIINFIVLLICMFKRRAFGTYLGRDIAYVAEYLFANWMTKKVKSEDTVSKDNIEYMDSLLLREDMDFFAIMWGNTMSKMKLKKV
jgi:hypothetical protein